MLTSVWQSLQKGNQIRTRLKRRHGTRADPIQPAPPGLCHTLCNSLSVTAGRVDDRRIEDRPLLEKKILLAHALLLMLEYLRSNRILFPQLPEVQNLGLIRSLSIDQVDPQGLLKVFPESYSSLSALGLRGEVPLLILAQD